MESAVARSSGFQLEVRDIPQAGRPSGFSGAIGAGFLFKVEASRTVVSAGEPINLRLIIFGEGSLDGLPAPNIVDSLPKEDFSILESSTGGVIDEENNSKEFQISVRALNENVTGIPAIKFNFFNPDSGNFETVLSDPIALSVGKGNAIGADQVQTYGSSSPAPNQRISGTPSATIRAPRGFLSLGDFSLSPVKTYRDEKNSLFSLGKMVSAIIHVLAVLLFLFLYVYSKTSHVRKERSLQHKKRTELKNLVLSDANVGDQLTQLGNQLKELDLNDEETETLKQIIKKLELLAYDPQTRSKPLPSAVRDEIMGLLKNSPRNASSGVVQVSGSSLGLMLVFSVFSSNLLLPVSNAVAQDSDIINQDFIGVSDLENAHKIYKQAIETEDREEKLRLFGQSTTLFEKNLAHYLRSSSFYADWGNAESGAHNYGKAAWLYRRALYLNPGNSKAQINLASIESGFPPQFASSNKNPFTSLVFWQSVLSVSERFILASIFFLIAGLIYYFLSKENLKPYRPASYLFFFLWVVFLASGYFGFEGAKDDAVIITSGESLRSADSFGARPVTADLLPAGLLVKVVEERGNWQKISLNGQLSGWIQSRSLRKVVSEG